MSDNTTIGAEKRERVGKGSARAVRRAGRVPAVIYGDKKDPVGITLESREITRIVHQPGIFGRLLDLQLEGKKPHRINTRHSAPSGNRHDHAHGFSCEYRHRPKWRLQWPLNLSTKVIVLV